MRYTIPVIDSFINYIENADSIFLIFLFAVLLLQLYRTILVKNPLGVQQEQGSTENRQIAK